MSLLWYITSFLLLSAGTDGAACRFDDLIGRCIACDQYRAICATSDPGELIPKQLPQSILEITITYTGPQTTLRYHDLEHYPNLQNLTLKGNINDTDEDAFKGSLNLIRIEFTNTFISQFPDEVFQGLNKLSTLNIMGNRFDRFPVNTFHHLQHLRRLDVSHNALKPFCDVKAYQQLEPEFSNLLALREFVFDGIIMQKSCLHSNAPYIMPDGFFEPLYNTNITLVSMGGNYMSFSHHENNIFKNLTRLQTLNISAITGFTDCPKVVTDILDTVSVSLRTLYMENWKSHIPIRPSCKLDPSSMAPTKRLTNLTHISCKGSDRVFGSALTHKLFRHLSKIEVLDLTAVRAIDISDGTFDENPTLQKLILDENPFGMRQFYLRSRTLNETGVMLTELSLRDICHCIGEQYQLFYVIESYPAMEVLDISHNKLEAFPLFSRPRLPPKPITRLTSLSISNNAIPSLSSADMSFLFPNLSVFDAFNNKLTDIGNLTMKKGGELLLGENLLGNNMNRLCKTLSNMTGLVTLDLSANQIADPNCLSLLSQWDVLKTLNLSRNYIKSFDSFNVSTPNTTYRIRNVDLSYNRITTFSLSMLRALDPRYLESLDLQGNQIISISEELVSAIRYDYPQLRTFRITGNPIKCGCGMNWLPEWLQVTEKVPDVVHLLCHDSGKPIYEYHESTFQCLWMYVLIAIGSLVVAVVLISSIAIPCYKYRWFIFNLNFVIKASLKLAKSLEQDDRSMYDAYISYCDEDEADCDWVTENIQKVLEPDEENESEKVTWGS